MSKLKKIVAPKYLELLGLIFLIVGVCANATAGIFSRISDVSAVTTAFYRFILATPLFLAYFFMFDRESLKLPSQNLGHYLLAGFCFVAGIISAVLAFRMTTLANAELFGNLLPFVVVPLSWFLYRERITWNFFFALLIAFFGIAAMMIGKVAPTMESFVGDLLAFAISVLYGIYLLLVSRIRRTKSAAHTLFYCSSIAALMLFPYIVFFEDQWLPGNWESFFGLLGLSWVAHLIGAGFIVVGLGRVNQSLAAVIIMSQPIVGAIYGLVFMDEFLSFYEIAGIFICITGVIYAKFAAQQIAKPTKPTISVAAATVIDNRRKIETH